MGSSNSVTWTAFKNISDTTGTVNFNTGGSVTGNVTAQLLNLGTYGSDVTVGLTGANAGTVTGLIGGTFAGVSTLTGERGAEQHDGGDGADVSAGRDDGGHGQLEQRDVDGL